MPLGKRNLARFFSRSTLAAARKVRLPRVVRARKLRARGMKKSRVAMSRNCHAFRRFAADTRVNTTGTTSSHTIEYKFSDMVNPNDFADLYDRYMLTCVVHKFRVVNNPDATWYTNTANASATNWFPKLWYCPDYDDSSTETLQQLQQRAQTRCKVLQPNRQYKVVVKPAVTIQTYRTTTTTGYAPKWRQWIDMGQQDVPHYGLKFVVDTSAQDPQDTQPFIVEYTTQFFFMCKDVR